MTIHHSVQKDMPYELEPICRTHPDPRPQICAEGVGMWRTKMTKKALLFHVSRRGVTGLIALARNQNLVVKDPKPRIIKK